MSLSKRFVVLAFSIIIVVNFSPVLQAQSSVQPYRGDVGFRILMEGDPVGYDIVRVQSGDDTTVVQRNIKIDVTYFGYTAYRYRHTSLERWQNGQLERLKATTNDNGTIHSVTANKTTSGHKITTSDTTYFTDKPFIPSSYWNKNLVNHRYILNTHTGNLVPTNIQPDNSLQQTTDHGTQTVQRYSLTGQIELTVGYDDQNRWHYMTFQRSGSQFRYRPLSQPPNLEVNINGSSY